MKKLYSFLFIILVIHTFCFSENNQTDLIIFSYNRPLQLYALLESIEMYVKGINKTYIIYRTDNENFEYTYHKVFSQFSFVSPLKQTFNMTHNNFYELIMDILERTKSTY